MTEPNADIFVDVERLADTANNTLGFQGDGHGVIHFLRHQQSLLNQVKGEAPVELRGGFGLTGGHQAALAAFGWKLNELLEEFDKHNEQLCVFLEALREKMLQSAQAYQETESNNAQMLHSIRQKLDPR